MDFLSGTCPVSHLARGGAVSVEPAHVLQGLLKTRLRAEHSYHQMMDNMQAFIPTWTVEGVLSSGGRGGGRRVNF